MQNQLPQIRARKLDVGLLSKDLVFEDPFIESIGPTPYVDYVGVSHLLDSSQFFSMLDDT